MRSLSNINPFKPAFSRLQRGVAAVEFALVTVFIFFPLLIGIMEFGRWLFTLNAASEATRLGARVAVVCDMDDAIIKAKMRTILGGLKDEQISINYSPSACGTSACMVTVQLNGVTFKPLVPFMGLEVTIPPFTTALPREYLSSEGATNPACKT